MSKLLSVLLVESDEYVIKDVTASLRLANIPVMVAHSLGEVDKILGEVKPSMLIVRATVDAEVNSYVKAFVRRKDVDQVPIVVLAKNSEEELVAGCRPYCRGMVGLPVEFPAFTYRVQELFTKKTETIPCDDEEDITSEEVEVTEVITEKKKGKSKKGGAAIADIDPLGTTAKATIRSVDQRMVAAYSIQLLVLEALRKNPAFEHAGVEEVPKLVAEITNKICLSYRPA